MLHLQVLAFILVILAVDKSCGVISSDQYDDSTLQLVHVLFRHGDRANDAGTTYPNDPYKNETYYPYGLGQLTNKGKQREYMIGKSLRKRYNSFLGHLYSPDDLDAISTYMTRTKMSLELVLAGLYPPKNTELEWDTLLNWQPIPYNSVPFDQDKLLTLSGFYCANYIKYYQAYINSRAGQKVQTKYRKLYEYLTEHTGKNFNSTLDVYILYFGLTAEQEWGLKLPSWTDAVYPKYMEQATIDQYMEASATTKLKQLSGGFLVREMIKNMQLKVNKRLTPLNRKLFLYSGHEMNMGYVLNALEVYFRHVPPYGCYLLVELHKINGIYGVKVFYQDYSSFDPKPLKIPSCELFCPIKKFARILQKNIPTDDNMCNENITLLRKYEPQRRSFIGY